MRTIEASEVRKGMRIEVVREYFGAKVTIEGVSRCDYGTGPTFPLTIGDQTVNVAPDHPVTVLAEPEPEWVEGAWYWVQYEGDLIPMRRLPDGWQTRKDATYPVFADFRRDITVLGRVLIVDWPGHDVARYLSTYILEDDGRSDRLRRASLKVADAIRTQGGVR